uniref:hypothetical protein n=1 Tax=Novosphingobium sp. TaxID=1874826 RepID=UPI00286CCCA7
MNKGFKWIAIGTSTLVFVWGIHMIFGPWHNRQLARASFLIIAAVGCIAWGSFELALHTFGRSLAQSRDGSLRSTDKLIASLREGERLLMKTRYRSAASHVFELNAKLDLSLNYGRIDEGCSIYIAHNPELDELNLVEPLSPALARIHVGHGPKVMARRSLQSMRVTEIAGEIR